MRSINNTRQQSSHIPSHPTLAVLFFSRLYRIVFIKLQYPFVSFSPHQSPMDSNIFAVLTSCDTYNLARTAFGLNSNCHHDGIKVIAQIPTIDSREPSPASEPPFDYESDSRILLRLDQPPTDPKKGWQFGTHPNSNVLLGHWGTIGISGRHLSITVTLQLHVYIKLVSMVRASRFDLRTRKARQRGQCEGGNMERSRSEKWWYI